MPLTPRQAKFVDGVIGGKSATAAYMEAYGCSLSNADANASTLMGNQGVAAEIARRRSKIESRLEEKAIITRSEILKRLRGIGLGELADQDDPPSYEVQVRALHEAADLLGLRIEEAPHPDRPLAELSREERQRRLAELRAKDAQGDHAR